MTALDTGEQRQFHFPLRAVSQIHLENSRPSQQTNMQQQYFLRLIRETRHEARQQQTGFVFK